MPDKAELETTTADKELTSRKKECREFSNSLHWTDGVFIDCLNDRVRADRRQSKCSLYLVQSRRVVMETKTGKWSNIIQNRAKYKKTDQEHKHWNRELEYRRSEMQQ